MGEDRQALTEELATKYAAGKSVRELSSEIGRSYGFVHRLLVDGGVTMRGRGGATRGKEK